MKTHLITYATDRYVNRKKYFENEVQNMSWFDSVKVYNNLDIKIEFREKYKDILTMPRGGGYWIWKSHIIEDRLKEINEGDVLLYCDAGCIIQQNKHTEKTFERYLDCVARKSSLGFELGHQEYRWTNKKTLLYFKENYNLTKNHALSNQIMSTVKILKKDQNTQKYLNEFFNVLEADRFLITDKYNGDSVAGFHDHRHDQSIFSLLTKALNYGEVAADETWFEDWSKTKTSPIVAVRAVD